MPRPSSRARVVFGSSPGLTSHALQLPIGEEDKFLGVVDLIGRSRGAQSLDISPPPVQKRTRETGERNSLFYFQYACRKAHYFEGKDGLDVRIAEVPEEMASRVDELRGELLEALADLDDDFAELGGSEFFTPEGNSRTFLCQGLGFP